MAGSRWLAELAWIGRAAERVLIEVEDGRIARVTPGVSPGTPGRPLPGLTLPGLANAHSHAFHRALRGATESEAGDFWSWRDRMYAVAGQLDPDRYFLLARATYQEMVLAGVTAVGEFHYLHHGAGGRPYDRPNAMGEALTAAAEAAGLRLTLLDTCYLRAGFEPAPLAEPMLRFSDGSVERWSARAGTLRGSDRVRVGAAIHSVRAVDPAGMAAVAGWAAARRAPLHLHLSEQRQENEQCLRATGHTPAQLAAEAGVLGPGTTAVHATHLTEEDRALLGGTRTAICLCPTTERELGDGIGGARALWRAGSPLCLGSDSHAVIDLFEEARAVELDERLATERRGLHPPERLLEAATAGGMRALGWDAGRLEPGRLADFITVDLDSPRLAGLRPSDAAAHAVFAATAADVRTVVVGGEPVVVDGQHLALGPVGPSLAAALSPLRESG